MERILMFCESLTSENIKAKIRFLRRMNVELIWGEFKTSLGFLLSHHTHNHSQTQILQRQSKQQRKNVKLCPQEEEID